MPELPEVETICRQLNSVLTGQRIKSLQGSTLKVVGKRILGVKRKAKMIIVELSGGESLLIHLKMTGQLVYDENVKLKIKNEKQKHTRAVKLVLMDQSKMGGIGNIYANEALYCAGIDPRRPANTCGLQVRNLQGCIKKVINQGIKYGGSTASDENFVNARGKPGKYQEHFLVYEQEGKKCLKCKQKIIKVKLGSRGTYYCPGCQP